MGIIEKIKEKENHQIYSEEAGVYLWIHSSDYSKNDWKEICDILGYCAWETSSIQIFPIGSVGEKDED